MIRQLIIKRWRSELFKSKIIIETFNQDKTTRTSICQNGDAILKNDDTKHVIWKLAIVESLISRKDGISRTVNIIHAYVG